MRIAFAHLTLSGYASSRFARGDYSRLLKTLLYIRDKSLGDIHRRGAYATFWGTPDSREDRNAKGRVIGDREETPYFI